MGVSRGQWNLAAIVNYYISTEADRADSETEIAVGDITAPVHEQPDNG